MPDTDLTDEEARQFESLISDFDDIVTSMCCEDQPDLNKEKVRQWRRCSRYVREALERMEQIYKEEC